VFAQGIIMDRDYQIERTNQGEIGSIKTFLSAQKLLNHPFLNKGTAFSQEERQLFQLDGLLPEKIESLESQQEIAYLCYQQFDSAPLQYQHLIGLYFENQTLFFSLVRKHLLKMLPVLYTPNIGHVIKNHSKYFTKPLGLYLSICHKEQLDTIFQTVASDQIDLIIVTDGKAILGIGDQGIHGIHICHSKGLVYTLNAGIRSDRILVVQLDMGTNNEELLNDPLYLGLKQKRVSQEVYDDFIEMFVVSVKKYFPKSLLHWEDLGKHNAHSIIARYREQLSTFNDDVQGTGAVTLGCILSAIRRLKQKLRDQKIIIFGPGASGVGIANHLVLYMQKEGLSTKQAYDRVFLIGREGLITAQMNCAEFQKPYAKDTESMSLLKVIETFQPTILLGTSTVAGAFDEAIIKAMCQHVKHPIIMPLSNPTDKAEANPVDIVQWSNGSAIIATGSPFEPVVFNNKTITVTQNNNAYLFPGLGLGALASQATQITDNMLLAASEALAETSEESQDITKALLPPFTQGLSISKRIAAQVVKQALKDGVSNVSNIENAILTNQWDSQYHKYDK